MPIGKENLELYLHIGLPWVRWTTGRVQVAQLLPFSLQLNRPVVPPTELLTVDGRA